MLPIAIAGNFGDRYFGTAWCAKPDCGWRGNCRREFGGQCLARRCRTNGVSFSREQL